MAPSLVYLSEFIFPSLPHAFAIFFFSLSFLLSLTLPLSFSVGLSSQIDLLIQETSRLLQLTIEHDPHDRGSSEDQVDGPSPLSQMSSPVSPITQPPNQDVNNLRSRMIT